jgi:hypothetical protein
MEALIKRMNQDVEEAQQLLAAARSGDREEAVEHPAAEVEG